MSSTPKLIRVLLNEVQGSLSIQRSGSDFAVTASGCFPPSRPPPPPSRVGAAGLHVGTGLVFRAGSRALSGPQVEDLNARWQRYDASRDEYVRGLHAQLKGLQVPLEPELMRKEVSRLNAQLEEKMDDCAEARRELAAARSARDAALERVQMLEQQVRPQRGRRGAGPPSPPEGMGWASSS